MTTGERRLVRAHPTPILVQRWLHDLPYNWEPDGPTLRSFRGVIRCRAAHCIEAALAAATILEAHGYPPLLLDLESLDRLDHVVFAFRCRGRWGAVGGSRDDGLWGRRPVFRTVEALARSYYEPYVSLTGRITAYALADLRALGSYDWRLADHNVWKVERHLIDIPHRPLETSDRRYHRLRETYGVYLRRHDARGTPFTRGRRHWL